MEVVLKDYKTYGWIILIFVIVMLGVFLDFKSNNYELTYKSIEVAIGTNETEHKTMVSVPMVAQAYKLIANFFYGLAVTLFVSIFVARKLEADQQKKHEEELESLRDAVNINVFDALFKTLIPTEIFQIVKSEIIENKAIRRKAHWSFVFEEVNGCIKMTSTSHYELHNVSKEPLAEPINIELDPLASNSQEVLKAKCLSSDGGLLVEFDPEDDKNNRNIVIKDTANGGKQISYTVKVPPSDFIESTFEYCEMYDDKVYDCQHTKYPIIGLNISAVFPRGYKFVIYPSMSNELKEISVGPTTRSFKVDGGLLPRQGIVYVLEKVS